MRGGVRGTRAAGPASRLCGGGADPARKADPELHMPGMILRGWDRWSLGHGRPSWPRGRVFEALSDRAWKHGAGRSCYRGVSVAPARSACGKVKGSIQKPVAKCRNSRGVSRVPIAAAHSGAGVTDVRSLCFEIRKQK